MRTLAIGGLGLYGVANLFAGALDLALEHRLAGYVDVLLILTGAALLVAAAFVAKRSGHAWTAALTALILASLLAAYNERILGLGHPSHHLIRGSYTALVLYAAWRSTRRTAEKNDSA